MEGEPCMASQESIVCPVCHIGHIELHVTTYIQLYGETLICVPNTPAWTCDVCHERQYDPSSLQRIDMLVGQDGPPPNRYRPAMAKDKRKDQPPVISRRAEAPIRAKPRDKAKG